MDGFQVVKRRKQKRNPSVNILSIQHNTSRLVEEFNVERCKKKIIECRLEIQQSRFFQEFLAALNSVTQANGNVFCEIVSYGIGSINVSIISQYQTALVLCIAENFKIPCHFYDPVHSEAEVTLLEELGLISMVNNEECKKRVSRKTLFVMLHCGKAMYNNLLWSNWEPTSLPNVCIVGNAFSSYEERLTFKEFSSAAKYICKILPYTKEIKVKNSFKYDDIFNDTAVHHFPYDLPRNVPPELWKDNAEPERDERDVEIILKR